MLRVALFRCLFPCALAVALAPSALTADTVGRPVTASPGDPGGMVLVSERCPTFSWGVSGGAAAVELLVWRVAEPDSGLSEEPVLSEVLPSSIGAWTPPLAKCLEPGAGYSWVVRALADERGESLSAARFFRVRPTPTQVEVEEALEVLRRFLADGEGSLGAASRTARPTSDERTGAPPHAEGLPPRTSAVPALDAALSASQDDGSGATAGVVGSAASPDGFGVVADNTGGGADLLLGAPSAGESASVTEAFFERSAAGDLEFDVRNAGAGAMRLKVDGFEVLTTDTGAAAAHEHAGDDLTSGVVGESLIDAAIARDTEIVPTVLSNDGSGSGLDADTLDGVDSTGFVQSGQAAGGDLGGTFPNPTVDDQWVDEGGDTMSGSLGLGGNQLTEVSAVTRTGASNDLTLSSGRDIVLSATSGDIDLNASSSTIHLNAPTSVDGNLTVTGVVGVSVDDANDSTVDTVLDLTHNTSGTPAAGIGTAIGLQAEDTGGGAEDMAQIEAVFTDPTDGSEDSELRFLTRAAGGALTQHASLGATGTLTATAFSGDGSALTGVSASSVGFDDVSGATNTTAAMVVGTGASLSASGGGTIAATSAATATTATSLAANGGNCGAGESPAGVDASGAVEDCFDVATQAELNSHKASGDHDAAYVNVGGDTMSGNLDLDGNDLVDVDEMRKGTDLFLHDNGTQSTALGIKALESNTGSDNTATGFRALDANTSGYQNAAFGAEALRDNTTGYQNTAVGSGALQANTTGNWNTALGDGVLRSNTVGYENTASGLFALADNTSGTYNTASGSLALTKNTTGSSNVAAGHLALRKNETGNRNTALGGGALYAGTVTIGGTAVGFGALHDAVGDATYGLQSTAVGYKSLFASTTGYRNTAVGFKALQATTTSVDNSALGTDALSSTTTGNSNTGLGSEALASNTVGHRNIAIGRRAGYNTNGSDNILIGHQGVASESSTIRIGTAGTHTAAFVAGIRGVSVTGGQSVVVDASGRLGSTAGGSGSGLDADTLDGVEAAAFVLAVGDTMAGNLDLAGNLLSNIGASGTDFTGTGGLTLADDLELENGETISNSTDQVFTFSDGSDSFDVDLSASVVLEADPASGGFEIRAADGGSPGTSITVEAGDAGAASGGDGGTIVLRPGVADGAGVDGVVKVDAAQLKVLGGGQVRVSSIHDQSANAIAGFQAFADSGNPDVQRGFVLAAAQGTSKHMSGVADNDPYLYIQSDSSDFHIGRTSPQLTLDAATGNLGIGDSSPANRLHVAGNLSVGTESETLSNGGFALGGDDLFVAGTAGVEGTIYTDAGLTVGATTTLSDGSLASSGDLQITPNAGSADLLVTADNVSIDAAGAVTATSFAGDGSSLTGVSDGSKVAKAGDTMTGTLTLSPASGDALVTTAGKVGIGISAPTEPLHVAGPSTQLVIEDTASGAERHILQLSMGGGDAILAANHIPAGVIDLGMKLQVRDDGAPVEAVRIEPDGDVGLGTGTPAGGLHIVRGSGQLYLEDSSSGTDRHVAQLFMESGQVRLVANSFAGSPTLGLSFESRNAGVPVTAMTIAGDGDVGIGDTTPSHKLTVNGDMLADTNLFVGGGSEVIVNTGFVLDGNDLSVTGDAGVNGPIFTNTGVVVGASTTFADGSITQSTAGSGLTIDLAGGDAAGENLVVTANNVSIDAAGNVSAAAFSGDGSALTGITAADNTKVAKTGDTMTGALALPANALTVGTDQLVAVSGRVGVGTASPSTDLDVAGYAMASSGAVVPDVVFPSRTGTLTLGGNSPFDGSGGNDSFIDTEVRGSNAFVNTSGADLLLTGTTGAAAGSITGQAGSSLSTGVDLSAGSVSFTAGNTGFAGYSGGSVDLTAGDNTGGGSGGTVRLIGGLGAGGDGAVRILTGGSERLRVAGDGNVGIGITGPGAALHVVGDVQIVDGTQGAGKVLTSDAAGLASWTSAPAVPAGVIVMWSGTLASIPAGWSLCDGTNGTPDLRDRFIYGAGAAEEPGATGGAHTYSLTTAQLPSHGHPFSTNTNGSHVHDLRGNQSTASDGYVSMKANSAGAFDNRMDAAGDHSHTGTSDAVGSGSSIDNRPAYFKLALIMKS